MWSEFAPPAVPDLVPELAEKGRPVTILQVVLPGWPDGHREAVEAERPEKTEQGLQVSGRIVPAAAAGTQRSPHFSFFLSTSK